MVEFRCHAYARKKSYYKNRPQSLYPRMDTILRLVLIVARFHCIAVTSAVIERKTWNQYWLDRHQSLVLHSNSMQKRCNCLCAPNRVYLFTIYKIKTEKWKRCWTKRSHQPDAVPYKQPTERTKHILWSDEIMYVFWETNIWGKKLATKNKCFNWFKWIFAGFFSFSFQAVYCYTIDGLGPCYALEGEKSIIQWFRSHLLTVSKPTKNTMSLQK